MAVIDEGEQYGGDREVASRLTAKVSVEGRSVYLEAPVFAGAFLPIKPTGNRRKTPDLAYGTSAASVIEKSRWRVIRCATLVIIPPTSFLGHVPWSLHLSLGLCHVRRTPYTLLWYESQCTLLGLELVSWHLYMRLGAPEHVGEIFCSVLLLRGPSTWEPGRGVPGCRGGPCPLFGCLCSGLRDFLRWSYPDVSPFHLQNGLRVLLRVLADQLPSCNSYLGRTFSGSAWRLLSVSSPNNQTGRREQLQIHRWWLNDLSGPSIAVAVSVSGFT